MSNTEVSVIKDKVFEIIRSAINNAVDVIRPTFGPASNKVLISKILFDGIIDDGVQIARELELPIKEEHAVWKRAREVAIKTNDRVGDGTTSSLIILQAIINEVARKSRIEGRKIELEIKKGFEEVKKQLLKSSRQITTKEELKKVALISFDDENIANMIANIYFKLGKEGTITIAKSPTMGTSMEMSDGIKLDSGYISPYMIINQERMETVLEKPYILITDYRLTESDDILPIMDKMASAGKRELVLICENIEQSALATAVINKLQGKFLLVAINAPQGENKKLLLEDLALMTGARMFTESKGDKLQDADIEHLGRAERFICKRDESIILGSKGKKQAIMDLVVGIRETIKYEQSEGRKEELKLRLARFTNTLAVIKVGAPTENEQKTLKYKVEDAVNAVKVAYKSGVVCGAGLALSRVKTSSSILNEALKYPHRQLMENMGIDSSSNLPFNFDDYAINLVTGKVGNFMSIGVIDPVEVLLAGVESAVSIASILLTTSGIIVEAPKKPPISNE